MYRSYGQSLFPMGRITATSMALYVIDEADESLTDLLIRHQTGDWGETSHFERTVNDYGASTGLEVMSVFRLSTGKKLWVITSQDRRTTRVQVPLEVDTAVSAE